MRTDLQPVRGGDQISTDLRLLTARRTDLVFDRVRAINRLRATMLEYFPALEAAFDYSKKAPLILVAGYQTPDGIRRLGASRLTAWLKKRGARNAAALAAKAVEAAHAQHTVLATQAMGARLVARLAEQITAIDADLAHLDNEIEERFEKHPDAPILVSMPGFGVVLAATFLANTGGGLGAFENVDRLASVAGLAPAPRDSGRISGNHHRPGWVQFQRQRHRRGSSRGASRSAACRQLYRSRYKLSSSRADFAASICAAGWLLR